ncbi:MAG: copper resistance protein CopC [Candidatus Bipolaricaulota bacterium]|nr:copper resistance protein CopC [Candidatus Bipolaricaulota bacterium]MDW8031881.1 copper resistance protein CopC [Candidatus Bipolaricaulota bacterium]
MRFVRALSITVSVLTVSTIVGLLLGNPFVFGHAKFVKSNIENGKVYRVSELPDRLELTFEGELTPRSHVYVFTVSGTLLVDKGDVKIEKEHGHGDAHGKSKLSVALNKEKLTSGLYQVRWIAVDSDHNAFVEGGFVFAVRD